MAGITRGSIIIGNSSGNPAALAIGSSDYVLTSDGTDIAWEAASGHGTHGGGGGSFDPGSVEESMISDTDNTDDLGSSGIGWKDLYLTGSIYIDGTTGVTANHTVVQAVSLIPVMPGVYDISVTSATFQFASGILTRVL